MNLEAAAASLVEQFPASEQKDLARREEVLERFGTFAFGGFGVVGLIAVIGMIYVILTKMVFSGRQPWAGVILIAFLISAVLMLTYVVFKEDLKERQRKARPAVSPPEFENPAMTGKLLEETSFEPIPSVIEDTTELLPSRRGRESGGGE